MLLITRDIDGNSTLAYELHDLRKHQVSPFIRVSGGHLTRFAAVGADFVKTKSLGGMMNKVKFFLGVLIFGLTVAILGYSQAGTGELSGLVTDPAGAVIASASVTLTNTATGEKRATTSSGSGIYRFV